MLNRLSLNKLSLNRVDLNRIGGRDVGVSGRPYIDPELLSHVKMAISTWGKTNDDPDRAVLKDLTPNGNDMRLLNFGFAGNSGYGLWNADFMDWTGLSSVIKERTSTKLVADNKGNISYMIMYKRIGVAGKTIPSFKIKVSNLIGQAIYWYIKDNIPNKRTSFVIESDGEYTLPESRVDLFNGEKEVQIGFSLSVGSSVTIEQIPDFEGWLCTDGVEDIIESVKPVPEMLEGSNEITVVSIIHGFGSKMAYTNVLRENGSNYIRNTSTADDKTGIYGYTCKDTTKTIITGILGDKNDYKLEYIQTTSPNNINSVFSVAGWKNSTSSMVAYSVAYAGGFIANKVLTTDEINQVIAYYNLDRPGWIIKPQLYCNIKKQGITNDNHAEFNDQLIDFVGGHNIQLNNIGWEGESGIIDGALYLDGINDFGEVTGLPVLKDYTVVADRGRLNNGGPLLSKSADSNKDAGAFILELGSSQTYSYYASTNNLLINNNRCMSYQSKYIYNGRNINVGTGIDSSSMWLGTIRGGDNRFSKLALWSLMLFPYSLSEFLLERQLRKYKAGTLYPDMVEFRPIVKSNIPYSSISYSVNPGVYVTEGSAVTITITLSNASDKLIGVSSNAISDISISGDNGTYEITGKVTKSPQKISIVISSYLTMLGNDTLISNETLIKNE